MTLDLDFASGVGKMARIRVADGLVRFVPEPETEPDLVVRADVSTLAPLASGSVRARDAFAAERLELDGGREAIRPYSRLFGQPAA